MAESPGMPLKKPRAWAFEAEESDRLLVVRSVHLGGESQERMKSVVRRAKLTVKSGEPYHAGRSP